MEGLIEGRMVHYVAYNGRHLAAIVIGVGFADDIDMALFTNMENTNKIKNYGLQFHQSVPHGDDNKPGTWHFIERT